MVRRAHPRAEPDYRYKWYPMRWWILICVAFLNISINALWISFAPVASLVAGYYETTPSGVDLLTAIGFALGLPVCFASTYLVEKLGLRLFVHIAGAFVFSGGFLRFITTCPGINGLISKQVQYWMAVVGQALIGVANPMAFCLPTKVSQDWFPAHQAMIASGLITFAFIMGTAISLGLTPIVITEVDHIPYLNIMWFVPAAVTFVLIVVFFRRSRPPTPPNRSVELGDRTNLTYGQKLKAMFTNWNYMVIAVNVGGMIGFFNCIISQLQQMFCSIGYAPSFAGITGALAMLSGLVGCFIFAIIYQFYGHLETLAKLAIGLSTPFIIWSCVFGRHEDLEWLIILMFVLGGIFGFGILPLGVELGLEVAYPVDPASQVTIMNFSAQFQAALLIYLSTVLVRPLPPYLEDVETCTDIGGDVEEVFFEAKDVSPFLLLIMCHVTFHAVSFIIFLRPKMKRTIANMSGANDDDPAYINSTEKDFTMKDVDSLASFDDFKEK